MKINYDFESASCMLCGGVGLVYVNELRDDGNHWAAKCNHCGHVQVTPLPTIEEDEMYYNNNEQLRKVYTKQELNDTQMMYRYEEFVFHEVDVVKQFVPPGSAVLEIGSGYGWLVEKLRDDGYAAHGIELSQDKCDMALNRSNTELHSINLLHESPPANFLEAFDAVCMFHVLEHITDPIGFLKSSVSFLKNRGNIIIEVPNFNAYMKKYSQGFNAFSYPRGHVSYFTPETLSYTLKAAGFKDIKVFGKQVYSVENAIHWARNNVPFKSYFQFELPEGLEFLNAFFKKKMEEDLTSDCLVCIATLDV